MADAKLDALTALPSPLEATDLVYVVRGTTDYKALGSDITDGLVVGPASATDAVPVLFDGTTGKLVKNSTPTGTGNPVLATSPTLTTPNIGTPSAGTLTSCTGLPISTGVAGLGTGVATFLATPSSANLASAITDETGSGALVFADTPTLVTPVLGVATATSVNKVALTAPATSATLTLADGSTLATSGANSITLTSSAATNVTLPTTGTLATLAGAESLTNKKLGSLTSNGFVKTSGGDGTLSVDTTTYTNAAVVPSTAPSAGQLLVGNAGGTAYAPVSMSGDSTITSAGVVTNTKYETIIMAVSDETTALTTGTAKVTFRMPWAMTLSAVRASVTTAPTGSVLTVDINESGTTILSTKLTIDVSEKTSTTAATPPVISDTALADDAEITIDIDTVGSTIAGAGLKVALIGTRT